MARHGIPVQVQWNGVPPENLAEITREGMFSWDPRAHVGIPPTPSCYPKPCTSPRNYAPAPSVFSGVVSLRGGVHLPVKPLPRKREGRLSPPPSSDGELVTDDGDNVGPKIRWRKSAFSEYTTEPICFKMDNPPTGPVRCTTSTQRMSTGLESPF